MVVGIHQPNFFPWMGYFDKIAKSDIFIIMDDVQLSDSAYTQRNRVLNANGEIAYVTVPFEKKGYLNKTIREICINNDVDWKKRHLDFFKGTYDKFDFYEEIIDFLQPIYDYNWNKLCDLNCKAIEIVLKMLSIDTKIVYQSQLNYDKNVHKSELVLELCKSVGATKYLSGTGASKYMNIEYFDYENILVEYQRFVQPVYFQKYARDFVSGLSILDMLFNCGVEETKRLFQNR